MLNKEKFEMLKNVLDKEEKDELFIKKEFDSTSDIRKQLYLDYVKRMKDKKNQIAQKGRC